MAAWDRDVAFASTWPRTPQVPGGGMGASRNRNWNPTMGMLIALLNQKNAKGSRCNAPGVFKKENGTVHNEDGCQDPKRRPCFQHHLPLRNLSQICGLFFAFFDDSSPPRSYVFGEGEGAGSDPAPPGTPALWNPGSFLNPSLLGSISS